VPMAPRPARTDRREYSIGIAPFQYVGYISNG